MSIGAKQKLGYAAYLGASVIWGFSFMFTKRALDHLDGRLFDLLSYRFVISTFIMLALWAARVIKVDLRGKKVGPLFLMSFLQPVLYFIFETLGVGRVTTSEVGLILASFPIMNTLFGVMFLREKVTVKHWGFIFLSVSGVILINVLGYVPGSSTNLGRLFLMAAVLVGTTYGLLTRTLSTTFSAEERTLAMMVTGAVAFTAASLYGHIKEGTMALYLDKLFDASFLLTIAYLSVGCSLVAFFLISYSATHLELSKSSVLGNTNTLVAVLAGVLILKEPFYWYHIIGGLIIVTGVLGAAMASSAMVAATERMRKASRL